MAIEVSGAEIPQGSLDQEKLPAKTTLETLATGALIPQMFLNGDMQGAIMGAQRVHDALDEKVHGITNPQKQEELSSQVATVGSSVTSIFLSFLNFIRGKVFACDGYKTKDSTKLTAGILRMARGGSEFFTNGSKISSQGIGIAQKADGLKNVIAGLAIASTAGMAVTSSIIATTVALDLKESYKLSQTFESKRKAIPDSKDEKYQKAVDETYDELQKAAKIQQADINKIIEETKEPKISKCSSLFQKLFGNEKTRLALEIQNFFLNKTGDQDELREKAEKLGINVDPRFKGQFEGNELKQIYATIELERVEAGKAKRFSKVFGDIKLEKGCTPDAKVKAIEAAHANIQKNRVINALVGFLSLIGMGLGITMQVLANTPVGFAVEMVELGLSLALSFAWILIDGYSLLKEYSHGEHTVKEKALMILSTIASGLITLASIVILKFGTSLSKVLLPATAIILWATASLYSIYHAKTKKVSESAA